MPQHRKAPIDAEEAAAMQCQYSRAQDTHSSGAYFNLALLRERSFTQPRARLEDAMHTSSIEEEHSADKEFGQSPVRRLEGYSANRPSSARYAPT